MGAANGALVTMGQQSSSHNWLTPGMRVCGSPLFEHETKRQRNGSCVTAVYLKIKKSLHKFISPYKIMLLPSSFPSFFNLFHQAINSIALLQALRQRRPNRRYRKTYPQNSLSIHHPYPQPSRLPDLRPSNHLATTPAFRSRTQCHSFVSPRTP